MKKVAQNIYKLAWQVEHGHKEAARWSKFRDEEGNPFFIPYDQTDKARKMYSPFTRRLSPREGLYNIAVPTALDEAFSMTSAVKTAERLVIFQCDDGRTFALPQEVVGNTQFAWSPWDRSRARRDGIINVPLNQKLEEAFELEASEKVAYGQRPEGVKVNAAVRAERVRKVTVCVLPSRRVVICKTEDYQRPYIVGPYKDVTDLHPEAFYVMGYQWHDKAEWSFDDAERLDEVALRFLRDNRTASSKTASVPDIILKQLGGMNRLKAMIGATNFISYPALSESEHGEGLGGVSFRFSNPTRGRANFCKIILDPSDTYIMQFGRARGTQFQKLNRYDDVYAGRLGRIFEDETGLYLTL